MTTTTTTVIQTVALDDSEVMFRSRLLTGEKDGPELLEALDRLKMRDRESSRRVLKLGALGVVSYGRAVEALRTYHETSVITYPAYL